MVELLSICPTNWGMDTASSRQWLVDRMLPYYPIGDFKVSTAVGELKTGGN